MPDGARGQHQENVRKPVVRRVGAERGEHEQERHEQRSFHVRQPGQLADEKERERDGHHVREHDDPHHRIGDAQVSGEHGRSRHEALDQEDAQQNRHRHAAGDPEGDRRNQVAAFARIVHRAGREHTLDVALAEGFRVLRRLLRVGVRDELRDRASHPGNDADTHADQACAKGQPPVLQRVTNSLRHAGNRPCFVPSGDAATGHHQLQDFGAAEEARPRRARR